MRAARFVPALSLFLLGCPGAPGCASDAPPAVRRFFSEGGDLHAAFGHLSPQDQVDVAIYAYAREPPTDWYADEVARQGNVMMPVLMQKLSEQRRDWAKRLIIHIVFLVHNQTPLRVGPTLAATLASTITAMGDTSAREESARDFVAIFGDDYRKWLHEQ